MAITKRAPNTIHLSGYKEQVNDIPAIEAITPGMLVEYHNDSGTLKWGVHDSANDPCAAAVALEQTYANKGITDAYAAGDLVVVGILGKGAQFYGLVPSGQNITQGDYLQSNGDGKLKANSAGKNFFVAVQTIGAVTEDTRIRVEVV